MRDITVRKNAESVLVRERELLRTLIDNLPDAIYVKDEKSRFLLANVGVARSMGADTPEELIGKTDHDYFPKELADQYYSDEQAVIQSGLPVINKEEIIIHPDGSQGQVLTTQVPLRNKYGEGDRTGGNWKGHHYTQTRTSAIRDPFQIAGREPEPNPEVDGERHPALCQSKQPTPFKLVGYTSRVPPAKGLDRKNQKSIHFRQV